MNKELRHRDSGTPEFEIERFNMDSSIPILDYSVNLNPLSFPDIIKDRWSDDLRRSGSLL